MTSRLLTFIVGIALVSAAPAAAQNATTPGSFELYPTINSIGARLVYTGDANANAAAHLEWRLQGAASWTRGVDLTRITNSRWAGSVLWLDPDTPYDVRAIIDDPDGGGNASASVRTRTDAPPVPTGRTWWVATNGSDGGTGDASSPLATIQAAVDRAAAGDQVRVKAGTYYQTVHLTRSGTAAALMNVIADGPGVIVDLSDPAQLHRSDWRDDGGGTFSIPFTATTRLVCADSLQRLYHQASVAALQANGNGVSQGWVIEGGRLSVKLEDGSSPNTHTMHVSRYENGFFLEGNYGRVSGFEVRYWGMGSAAAGIYLRAASRCEISDNYVHAGAGRGIFLRVLAADNVIERNHVIDPRVASWPWSATKAHDEEITGISIRGGRGNVVRFNSVSAYFDGLDANDGTTDENVAADCDYYGNLVTGVGDDGIETDTISGLNLRLWQNVFDRCYSGFSVAPNYQGPEYIVYNTITNTTRGGFKFSLSGTGQTFIYHNTLAGVNAGAPAVHPSGPYSNIHFRNNIMVGNGAAAVSDDAGESDTGNDFDGDLINSNYGALFRWKNTNYSTIALLRSATGFEINGRAGDPQFVAAASGDYRLLAGSPAIDGGLRIAGINDRFNGAAPDMGAFESGVSGADATPPAAITNLSVID